MFQFPTEYPDPSSYYTTYAQMAALNAFLFWFVPTLIFFAIGIFLALFVVKRHPRARLKRDRMTVFAITIVFWPVGIFIWAFMK